MGFLHRWRHLYQSFKWAFADGGYAGNLGGWIKEKINFTLKIVQKVPGDEGFGVIKSCYIFERNFVLNYEEAPNILRQRAALFRHRDFRLPSPFHSL